MLFSLKSYKNLYIIIIIILLNILTLNRVQPYRDEDIFNIHEVGMGNEYTENLKNTLLEKELNRMLTITEAAELLGVSCASMRRYANEGKIRVYRVGSGKHRRFRKRDVLEYLEMNSEY